MGRRSYSGRQMNERIKALWDKAAMTPPETDTWEGQKAFIEKFAKLIIAETLMAARAGMEYGPSMDEAVEYYFNIKL